MRTLLALQLAFLAGAHATALAQAPTLTSRLSSVVGNFLVGYATVSDSGSFSETLRTLDTAYEQQAADDGGVDTVYRDLPVAGLGGFAVEQRYDVGPGLISLLGVVGSHASSPYTYVSVAAAATSTLTLEFTASVTTPFVLSGEVLSAEGPGVGGVASDALAQVQLTGTGVALSWRSDLTPGSFAASGTLFAGGRYRLHGNATSKLNGDASYRLSMALSPVPEPAAWPMALVGTAWLLQRQRRRAWKRA